MAYAVKINTKRQAWELGAGSAMEQEMIERGKIRPNPDDTYEIFSKEASKDKGEIAKKGDFFKVDKEGFPCPSERNWFLRNHLRLEGDWYLQDAKPLKIWRKDDPECEELRFLLDKGRLFIHPDNPERYFSAFLWGTEETAAIDAVIVFYVVAKDPEGKITDINFNFVDEDYFQRNYKILS